MDCNGPAVTVAALLPNRLYSQQLQEALARRLAGTKPEATASDARVEQTSA